MSSLRWPAVVLAGSAILWTTPIAVGQEQDLVVEGRLTNATPGGAAVSGVTVVFHRESPASHTHLETTTESTGGFRFEGIVFDPSVSYGITVKYQGRDLRPGRGPDDRVSTPCRPDGL